MCQTFIHEAVAPGRHDSPPLPSPRPKLAPDNYYRDQCVPRTIQFGAGLSLSISHVYTSNSHIWPWVTSLQETRLSSGKTVEWSFIKDLALPKYSYYLWGPKFLEVVIALDQIFRKRFFGMIVCRHNFKGGVTLNL